MMHWGLAHPFRKFRFRRLPHPSARVWRRVGVFLNQKSEIENQKFLVTPIRDPHHRQSFRILLNSHRDIEGVVSLARVVSPCRPLTPFRPILQATPLAPRLCGISRFSGHFSGTCGKTRGGGTCHRFFFLGNSQPLSEVSARSPAPEARSPLLWDFALFWAFLWDVWENRGRGWGVWRLGTRHSELGTGLPTCNLHRPTCDRFCPGYPGLVC
jgi:hypothetical protein